MQNTKKHMKKKMINVLSSEGKADLYLKRLLGCRSSRKKSEVVVATESGKAKSGLD